VFDHNQSIYVSDHERSYAAGEWDWLQENSGTAVLCLEEQVEHKFSPLMGYVTYGCLGVSLVCLIVHVIVTIIAPELHNLSGKNLLSLSLALIGFYSTFIINTFIEKISPLSCLILAVSMYYFILASFSWMFIIGFDVARTVKLATTQLRLSSGAQWCKYLVYSIIGWGAPAALVTTATLIDILDIPDIPDSFKPGFSNSEIGLCFFSSRLSLIIFFIIPFSIIMILNLVFFCMSGYFVWETNKSTAKITTSGPKNHFYLYARLSTLMGLSWITGVIAGALDMVLDNNYVWYVFLILNTLQGLFILVFFSCSKKVMSSVRERLCPDAQEDTLSTWQWSGSGGSKKEHLDSRVSGDSVRSSSQLTGSRPFKYSATSYDQYHKYDQRYYNNYNNHY